MSDHLPECYKEGSTDSCICDRLRACEQRVEREWIEHCNRVEQRVRSESWDHGMEVGTHSALDAAREAVAGMYLVEPDPAWDTPVSACVDAIDALRDTPTRINMEDPL